MPGAVSSLVERVARAQPDRVALCAPGREPLGYGALHALVGATGDALRERGVEPHDRVALVVRNGPEAAAAFLGVASAAACAPLNPTYRRDELDFYLEDLRVRAVVVARGLDSPVRDAAAARGVTVLELDADVEAPAGMFSLDGPAVGAAAGGGDGSVGLLLHTSGTTARPKLVPLTHDNLLASAHNVATTLELREDDRCLNVMPLFHIHGLVAALLASLHAGASVACSPGFHPLDVYGWLHALEPTWVTAVPTMHQAVLARASQHRDELAALHLRFVRSSSASLPAPVYGQLEELLSVPVVEAYGMTEAAHQMASNRLPPEARRPGSVGRAAGPEIAILSEAGDELPPGSRGEVAIRGANVFAGYERNESANAASFVDGWFRTGDEGVLDEEGRLTLTGRIKEQINRGGEKIAPLEVDERLLAHPAVAQAVTFAIPDARLGEEVGAAVVLEQGAGAVAEAALQDFVAQTLAPFKVPRRVVVVDEIPKGPTGKLQRIGLAAQLGIEERHADTAAFVEPRNGFERLVAGVWADVLGLPSVGVHDDFFALGGDSILGAETVARLRDLTGVQELPLVSIVRAPTVAGMVRELDGVAALERSGPVLLDPSARGAPFFFVHGGDGEVLSFVSIARAAANVAVYGIRATGIDDGAELAASVDAMASEYVAGMQRVQPAGPYALGGFCFGGTVALAMAHLLRADGEQVAAVVLVDPRLPRPTRSLRYDAWLVPRRLRQGMLLRSVVNRVRAAAPRDVGEEGSAPVERAIARLREAHVPRPYPGDAVLVLGSDPERHDIPVWHLRCQAPAARVVRLPFPHLELTTPPGSIAVAAEIERALGVGTV